MANDTRRLRVVVTGESEGASQALEQVGNSAEKTESKLTTLAKTVAGFAGKGILAFGAMGAAAATMGITTASQMEQAEVGFKTMLGSAEKAKKFLSDLQKFANTTPFEFGELTGAAQRLMAMGFAANDVIPMLTAVGDAVAAMGGSAESVDSVTTALGQMQAKGKVSGEELMQLTEQGIPALKILADSYKVSTAEMSAMITAGKVQSDKAIPLLIKGLEQGTKSVKGFAGMMNAQSQTMNGKWSTLMDTLKSGLGNIAAKFLPAAKVAIDLLSVAFGNFFAGLQGSGKLKGFSGTINEVGLGIRAMILAFKDGDVTSDGLVGKFERMGVIARQLVSALNATKDATIAVVGWFREHENITKTLTIATAALVTVTKAHAIVTGVQAAGGLLAMFKNLQLVQGVMKIVTAVQWAYNGALAAAGYLQIAGYLAAIQVQQKLMAVWTKVVTAAQWLWNAALTANPIGIIIVAVAALVGAIILLWKNNEGFRKFVLNVLWPAIKKTWEAIKNTTMVVVNALVTAFNWVKDKVLAAWNAIWAFLAPIIQKIISIITPIISVILKIGSVIMGFYNATWKIIWILIQVAVKIFLAYVTNVLWPTIKFVFNVIAGAVKFLYNIFKSQFNLIKNVIGIVVGWVSNYVVGNFKKAWDAVSAASARLRNGVALVFNAIRAKVDAVIKTVVGPVFAVFNAGLNKLKGWLNVFKIGWNILFDAAKNKAKSALDGVVAAFNKGRDGIKKAWDSVVNITKKPINFVINDVYNDRIRTLWNKVAGAFGIGTRLDTIKGFARGGIVPGSGSRDSELAMLTPGEGILTKKEMRSIGGPRAFNDFRKAIAQYNGGGVVGGGPQGDGPGSWLKSLTSKAKDFIQGIAGPAIKPLANAIKSFMDNHLQGGGFTGLLRGGGHKMIDSLMSWVTKKDKEMPAIGGTGGAGMGFRRQQALISQAFPGLHMISGFRPGATTLSGNRSYHSMGRAVDYPPNRALALWIRSKFGSATKELITPWNELNLHNGRPHRYTGAVWNQHNFAGGNAHDHWAMDGTSRVDPGWFMGYNGTGKPEQLTNTTDGLAGIVINGGLHLHGVQDVKSLRNELLKLAKNNGGRSGLPSN